MENQAEEQTDLQKAFLKFRDSKKQQFRHGQYLNTLKQNQERTPEFKQALRQQFIDAAMKYRGIPYHRRYHEPGDEFYDAPLYLDCCGLIRQVIIDLKEQFGFTLQKYNQAYQFDTLPIDLEADQMIAGDLVFITGTYFNEKAKRQIHDMVHVEIYMGDQKSLGARIQKGTIQVFDNYKFDSKSYYNMKYYYKSIDTWLDGVCKSFCPDHDWNDKSKNWVPDKYSIFASEDQEIEDTSNKYIANIGKGNNDKLIRQYFQEKENWIIQDTNKYNFKWCQSVSDINYFEFKEGNIVCHIPNIMQILTNKKNLLQSIYDFENDANNDFKIRQNDIIPETYRLDNLGSLNQFLQNQNKGIWVKKPFNQNMGRGIEIIHNIDEFKEQVEETMRQGLQQNILIQKYLEDPFLYKNKKFDIRCFMLIGNTKPFLVLYHEGYLRLSINDYQKDSENQFIHLTNNAIQRKHPDYKQIKDQLIISMEEFDQYLIKNDCKQNVEQITKQIKLKLSYVFQSIKHKIQVKKGYYELLGCDFILDQNLNPYLLEINSNPAIFTDVPVLNKVITKMMNETLDIVLNQNGYDVPSKNWDIIYHQNNN